MNLFIKVRSNKDKGWEGSQYLINAEPNGDKKSVEYSGEGWNFKKIGEAQIRWQGRNLAIVIPRKLLGVENDADLKLEFKWSDNMRNRDIMDSYENGDAAAVIDASSKLLKIAENAQQYYSKILLVQGSDGKIDGILTTNNLFMHIFSKPDSISTPRCNSGENFSLAI